MILERGEGPIESVELRGLERAAPSDAVLEAIAEADAIVIGPSNPVISIGPILALPGMREALRARAGAGGGGEPVRGRPLGEGTDRGVLRAGRHRAERGRRGAAPTPTCSTGSWPTSRWTATPGARDRHAHGQRRRPRARLAREVLDFAALGCAADAVRCAHGTHDRHPACQELRRCEAAPRRRARHRRAPGARTGDVQRRDQHPAPRAGTRRDRRGHARPGRRVRRVRRAA